MDSFNYYNPVRIVFGRDTIRQLSELVPQEAVVLILYGGGSIKRNGVYDSVKSALGSRKVLEFGGIEPNPKYETLMQAVEIARNESVTFLLAVGGGSVLDGTKFVAAATLYPNDTWQMVLDRAAPDNALSFGAVLTLPATGSEMNRIAVISCKGTEEKMAFVGDALFPKFSILDPEATFSLPRNQVRNGVVDSFIHVVEQYITYPANAPLQDRQAEAILCTLHEVGPVTLENPQDGDARASFMWCATQALNGQLGCGVPGDFATHRISHEITAFYGVTHAEALAAILPAVWRHCIAGKRAKLAQYGARVFSIDETDEATAAEKAIKATEEFFHELGMGTQLRDYGVPQDAPQRVADRFKQRGTKLGERGDLHPEDIAAILTVAI